MRMVAESGNSDFQTLFEPLTPRELNRAEIKARIKAIYERRAAGDIDALLAFLAPDVVFFLPTTWSYASYPRPFAAGRAFGNCFTKEI